MLIHNKNSTNLNQSPDTTWGTTLYILGILLMLLAIFYNEYTDHKLDIELAKYAPNLPDWVSQK